MQPVQPTTTFEKYEALQGLKKTWKKFKSLCKEQDAVYFEYMEVLPDNPSDLPSEYVLAAFSEHAMVPCRACAAKFKTMRQTHHL